MGVERLTDYCFRKGVLALNVKVYNYKLPDETKRRLKALTKDQEYSVLEAAEDRAREDFWNWAKERADELDLEKLYSDGRSGGWMILPSFTSYSLEVLQFDLENTCLYCDLDFGNHADGKCLYNAGTFTPDYASGLNTLDRLEQFSKDILAALEGVGDSVDHYLTEEFDNVTVCEGVPGV